MLTTKKLYDVTLFYLYEIAICFFIIKYINLTIILSPHIFYDATYLLFYLIDFTGYDLIIFESYFFMTQHNCDMSFQIFCEMKMIS